MSDTKPKEPGAEALDVARVCVRCGGAALLLLAGFLSKGLGFTALSWGADAAIFFVLALGFMLYYWGARSATRRAAKGEDTQR